MQARAAAYAELLTRSLAAASRIQAARTTMQLRSGLQEGLSILLHHCKPLDFFDFYDWLHQDMTPLHEAWSKVWMVGSQEAMDAADRLVTACADLFTSYTEHTWQRRIQTTIRGIRWTPDEIEAFNKSLVLLR
jgi:hypothetical protein